MSEVSTVNVLIAYATKNGSTGEVAEFIAAVLRDGGEQVTIATARSLRDPLDRYDLIVLGAPLYSGRWHADARRFLRRHRHDLASVPVAIFGMGPRTDTELAWQRSRAQLGKAVAKHQMLVPADVTVFGGADPAGRGGRPRRDLRDWSSIREWAAHLTSLPRSPAGHGVARHGVTGQAGRPVPPATPGQTAIP